MLVRPRLAVGLALAALVVASTTVRSIAWWHKATPSYFPDEYLYAELARSLAETGQPLVRGAGTGFPALLQPLLTAPLWLFGDVALSYHLVQVLATLAMSLVVVPVYLLARRLGLGAGIGIACAAFALAVPDFLYASRILAEPFGYPIALAAVLVGTIALAGGGTRWQVGFLALVALAVLTRVQFLVLPIAYVAAIGVVGLRERALGRLARQQTLVLAVFGVVFLASVARPSAVGQYGAFLEVGVDPRLAGRLATNGFGLAYACGWLLVPGAILGAVPRDRAADDRRQSCPLRRSPSASPWDCSGKRRSGATSTSSRSGTSSTACRSSQCSSPSTRRAAGRTVGRSRCSRSARSRSSQSCR